MPRPWTLPHFATPTRWPVSGWKRATLPNGTRSPRVTPNGRSLARARFAKSIPTRAISRHEKSCRTPTWCEWRSRRSSCNRTLRKRQQWPVLKACSRNCSYVATSRTALDAPAMRKWTAQRVWSRRYVRSFGRFRRYANRWSMLSDGGKENGPPKSGPFPTRNIAVLSHRRAQATSYWETLAVLREFCGCSPA